MLKRDSHLTLCISAVILMAFPGCDVPTDEKGLTQLVQQTWDNVVFTLTGEAKAPPSPQPSKSMATDEYSSSLAKDAKANAETLREMLTVIYNQEPKDRSEFGNWADTLNQGASYEGVYNGLTRSEDYRKLEKNSKIASPEALKTFSEELALLEAELPSTTEFDTNSASPLPNTSEVTETKAPLGIEMDRQSPAPAPSARLSEREIRLLTEKYTKQFVGLSVFTLKRVLCEEALKVVSSKEASSDKLALWYSKWVLHMAERRVDFGIELRNKPDESFHFKWALQASQDRLKWEVLNRIHRVLNESNKEKQ